MKRKLLLSLFATFLLISIPTMSFASGNSLASLKHEVKVLKAKVSSLTSSNKKTTAKYNSLVASNKKLTAKYNSLVASNKSLTAKYNSLAASNKSLTAKYNSLAATNKNLTAANATLTANNKKLTDDLASVISKKNGTIYIDGAKEGNADFVSYQGKQYVAMDGIVPALRGTDENYKYITSNNALYVGTFPVSGLIQLTNLPYYYRSIDTIHINKWDDGKSLIVNGKKMLTGFGVLFDCSCNSEYIDYKLNGKYRNLSFKAGLDDLGIGNGTTGSITVYADGNVIYDSGLLETQDDPKLANLDVSDIKMLRIEFHTDDPYSTYFVFGDPLLTP
ncbi:NPCBM/NEW2 domain-containing protein [Bacillus sp. UNC438CL73TsuS30]|uniref:NPCBM/NEW2 domain-containing protein n=1 Tax=Bacillus sp. UNC438CL73TsuS30 TaxID=1340434 RepID=UPI00047AE2A9|nr:NPCBM/NEW2 domain-containing protein [Bacillus sp. UNC438CL73TsuS30]